MNNGLEIDLVRLIECKSYSDHYEEIVTDLSGKLTSCKVERLSEKGIDSDVLLNIYKKRILNLKENNISYLGVDELIEVLEKYSGQVLVADAVGENEKFILFFSSDLKIILGVVQIQ